MSEVFLRLSTVTLTFQSRKIGSMTYGTHSEREREGGGRETRRPMRIIKC